MREKSQQMLVALHEMTHTVYSLEAGNISPRQADTDMRDSHNKFELMRYGWRRELLEKIT